MPKFTPQQLDELYHQTLAEFAASPEKWTSFLDTAARLYKYDFKGIDLVTATGCNGLCRAAAVERTPAPPRQSRLKRYRYR